IVDDVYYSTEEAFTDGVVADAIDIIVDSGSLYFSSAGNNGMGYRFTSDFECTTVFNETRDSSCDGGAASHVFQPNRTKQTDVFRYLMKLSSTEAGGPV
ncbi:unnamed protein product, partial [Pylaiella littoralis]